MTQKDFKSWSELTQEAKWTYREKYIAILYRYNDMMIKIVHKTYANHLIKNR